MQRSPMRIAALIAALPIAAWADPTLECSADTASQIDIAACVGKAETAVDQAVALAFGFAKDAAEELDRITERDGAAPALTAGQAAWTRYRDAHCAFVGTTFGGGSGTGIAIRSCRVALGRARVSELMEFVR